MKKERCGRKENEEENIEDEEGGDGVEDVLFWFLWHFLSNEAVN